MANFNRVITFLEGAKNAVIVLGIPALGLYMWNYHKTQVQLKDSIIELQQTQLAQAKDFSVETANARLLSMKSLYESLLSSASDSLEKKTLLLDSLTSKIDPNDTTLRQHGKLILMPRDMLVRMAANRIALDTLLMECRSENRLLRELLKAQ